MGRHAVAGKGDRGKTGKEGQGKAGEGDHGKAVKEGRGKAAKAGEAGEGRRGQEGAGGTGADADGERYPMPVVASLPEDIRARILAVQEKSGFVPNVFLKLARRPAEFRAFFNYHDALMLKESGLSKAEREMIVVATSALNQCLYCVVAHGAILRIYQKDALIADQVATNYRKAKLAPRQGAMLEFACKVATDSAAITDEDHDRLARHGFDAETIWDIAAIAAFFALSNRMANFASMMPNEEFYLLGRIRAPQPVRGDG